MRDFQPCFPSGRPISSLSKKCGLTSQGPAVAERSPLPIFENNPLIPRQRFFQPHALSSPILVKVHFDVITTMIADTLYSMLAQKLRGFESRDASRIYRLLVKGKGKITLDGKKITVTYPRRAHNPIL